MTSNKKEPPKKERYFNLTKEDRLEFELKDKEKKEKENVAKNVMDKLNGRHKK
ncbi:hypothetical protein [Virgibacillus sp. YIM 98842]|uniref:hypothetical protein n=1 Tax=Virgibacillus sp. YIM 98842 TaxID=2663533 RepID=UPI0013DA7394|nr:hypothetical protein [Virgibacillus sp. YIM 98842]